jgi:hypothetical protein
VMDEKYASGLFRSGDSYQFDLINDPAALGMLSVFNYLQGRVAGLQVTVGGADGPGLSWRGGTPQVFLDELPVDADVVMNIPMSDIAYVKVMRPPFVGAAGGGGSGAISVYTRKGGDQRSTPGKGLSASTLVAYTPIRQFYSPNYSSFKPENDQKDIRTTLYWNPMLETSSKKTEQRFTFYNNDVTKSFRIVVEGMTADGQLTHLEQILE